MATTKPVAPAPPRPWVKADYDRPNRTGFYVWCERCGWRTDHIEAIADARRAQLAHECPTGEVAVT
jgi:hypothetical protein